MISDINVKVWRKIWFVGLVQDNFIWLRIHKTLVYAEGDLYVGCVYISQTNFSFHMKFEYDVFQELEAQIVLYMSIVFGIWNRRSVTSHQQLWFRDQCYWNYKS